jgi:hypothetical protein
MSDWMHSGGEFCFTLQGHGMTGAILAGRLSVNIHRYP